MPSPRAESLPRWPWRWLYLDLLPGLLLAAIIALVLALFAEYVVPRPSAVPLAVAAAFLVAYIVQLIRVRRLGTGAALGRMIMSVVLRWLLAAAVLSIVAPPLVALAAGLAISLLAGFVQLTRLVAIGKTFGDDAGSPGSEV